MENETYDLVPFDEILRSCQCIPFEIIYHYIIPYVPYMDLSRDVLLLQKRRIIANSLIERQLLMECPYLKRYIFTEYQGEKTLRFELDNNSHDPNAEIASYYLYVVIDFRRRQIIDFLSIFS